MVGELDGRPCLWRDGAPIDLGIPGPGSASAINNQGQIIGMIEDGYPSAQRPFLWQHGQTTYLDTLGGQYTFVVGIDSSGRVTGYSSAPAGQPHAVVWIPKS